MAPPTKRRRWGCCSRKTDEHASDCNVWGKGCTCPGDQLWSHGKKCPRHRLTLEVGQWEDLQARLDEAEMRIERLENKRL